MNFMEPRHDLSEQDADSIRQEIDCTRSALTDKLEALEHQVMGTVQNARESVEEGLHLAKETVEDTVQAVKSSVRDTVASVKRTFDVRHHVERHPWATVGGSVLAGLAFVSLLEKLRGRSREPLDRPAANGTSSWRSAPSPEQRDASTAMASQARTTAVRPSQPGFLDQFHEELDKAKVTAVSYTVALLRDALKRSVPEAASHIDDFANGVVTRLGGKPIHFGSHEPAACHEADGRN
jgi:ElaB/YqjD/DUF883 family membrane-anchored ribosome-binding protein